MIEFRDVSVSYGETPVLDGISIAIEDDEFVALVGANGSGKTTLLGLCNGLVTPDAGAVVVDGTAVEADLVAARTRVGMVFQHPRDQFVAATVGADVAFGPENLGLERGEIDRRVETALEAVNMAGRDAERIDQLSGGEQSRVAIAGALAMEPTHLLLDEPARQSVCSHLETLSATGTGVIVATHDLRDVVELADRLVALRDGQIAADGPPEALVSELETFDVRIPGGG